MAWLNESREALETLQDHLEEAQAAYEETQASIVTAETRAKLMQAQLAEVEAALQEKQAALEESQCKLDESQCKLETVQGQLEEAQASIVAADTRFDEIRNKAGMMLEKIDGFAVDRSWNARRSGAMSSIRAELASVAGADDPTYTGGELWNGLFGEGAAAEEEDGSVTIPSYCDPEKPWGYRKPEEVKGVVTPTEQSPQEITKRDTKPVAGFELD